MRNQGLTVAVVSVLLTAISSVAAAQGQSSYRNEVVKAQHPGGNSAAGTRTGQSGSKKGGKVSSFAPHRTQQRVFGAPIQAPIVKRAPPPKKTAPR